MEINYYFLGLVLLILLLSRAIRPSKINRFIGYRSPLSMKNQNTWAFANKYARNCILTISVLTTVFHLVASFYLESEQLLIISLIYYAISLLSIIVFTELALNAIFDKNGIQK